MAVIVGLEALKKPGQKVTVFSDSKYFIDAIDKKWVYGWIKKGFAGKKNKDLWERLLRSYRLHQVQLVWVKGHAGHPLNERCDALRSEEHTSELQSRFDLVCRLLLEKKNNMILLRVN